MNELEVLAAMLDKLPADPQAGIGYDYFAGGLVWSDEVPAWNVEDFTPDGRFPPGHGNFRALLNYRSGLIAGEPPERFRQLWEKAQTLCPNWPGFLPGRRDSALATELRQRADASRRSFDELDARIEQQRIAKTNKVSA
jgi:hypothetical protein